MIRNTSVSWGWPARALHWIVAAMVLGALRARAVDGGPCRGAASLPGVAAQRRRHQPARIAAAGFVWWLLNVVPAEPAGTPAWQRRAAQLAHWGLYALIFAATVAGWALTGTMRAPIAVDLFGFIGMPQLVGPRLGQSRFLEEAHELLAYVLIALVVVHVAAALYHHFMLRDAVLLRMLGRKPNPTVR